MGWLKLLLAGLKKLLAAPLGGKLAKENRADFSAVTDMWQHLATKLEERTADLSAEVQQINKSVRECQEGRLRDAKRIASLEAKVEKLMNEE